MEEKGSEARATPLNPERRPYLLGSQKEVAPRGDRLVGLQKLQDRNRECEHVVVVGDGAGAATLALKMRGQDVCPHCTRREAAYWRERAKTAEGMQAKMEAAIRWAMGEQPLADGRWFDEREFGHLDNAAPVYWWRTILRLYSGLADGNAAQPPPDSVSALREARRLLKEALDLERTQTHGSPSLEAEIAAFLGERSDRERSEP